VTLKLSAFFLS